MIYVCVNTEEKLFILCSIEALCATLGKGNKRKYNKEGSDYTSRGDYSQSALLYLKVCAESFHGG